MTLGIFLDQSQLEMKLVTKGRTIDSETFLFYHDIDVKLISFLDKLLKRNNIDTTALNSFKIQGNIGKNSTSYKIVSSFVEALKSKA